MCRPRAFCPEDSGREYYRLPARRVAPQTPNSGSRTSAARLSHSCARKCKCKCMQRCGPQAQQRELLRIGSIVSLWRRCAAPHCTALHRAALRCGHSHALSAIGCDVRFSYSMGYYTYWLGYYRYSMGYYLLLIVPFIPFVLSLCLGGAAWAWQRWVSGRRQR